MNARWLIPLGLLALIVLGWVWFVQHFERVPGKQHVGASGEARLRPFLAAERLATRMGLPASELRRVADLNRLADGGVLLLPAGRQALAAPQVSQILAWTARGGHAIVEAERPRLSDPLADALGIRRLADKQPPSSLLPAELPTSKRPLRVTFSQGTRLEAGGRKTLAQAPDGGSLKLVSFAHGKGVVTVCTRLNFARNGQIGAHDNAEFFWDLLRLTPAKRLAVFSVMEPLSLWRFLREHALPALIGGSLLLALWLWRIAPRFGPVPADAPPARRRLLEHLRASGRYLWSEGLRDELARAARDAALRRLARAQPDFTVASAREKAARLAALVDIPAEEAQRFISAGGAHSPKVRGAEFIRLAAIAQRVHFALEKGSR